MLDADLIARAKSIRIVNELVRRGHRLRKEGQWWVGPCPFEGFGTDRFFVRTEDDIFGCRGCDAGGDIIDLVMRLDSRNFFDAVRYLTGDYSAAPSIARLPTNHPADAEEPDNSPADKQQLIARLWREASGLEGTPAEAYLRRRLGEVPSWLLAGHSLRYHPRMNFRGLPPGPCLLGLYRKVGVVKTAYGPGSRNESIALHRTMITPDGDPIWIEEGGKRRKARRALGPSKNAAVKLVADVMPEDWSGPEITYSLGIAEGVETALAAWLMTGVPVWAVGFASNMAEFPLLPGIETLVLFVDHDTAGQESAAKCWDRWTAAGREVIWKIPNKSGNDFADLVVRA
jgi:hypothetical protein